MTFQKCNKKQKMTVHTKGQLLAAFECAKDFDGFTTITLVRKTGTTNYTLHPYEMYKFNTQINKLKRRYKKLIKSTELLS